MDFSVVQGDTATEEAEALVNAAGTSLRMGSGVAGALLQEANGPIEREARRQGPVNLGDVVVTDAYDLDAKYVIHAAVVPHGGVRQQATTGSICRATRNSLSKADELACRSVVLPALGCGNGGFYIRDGGELVYREIWGYEPDILEEVRVVGYSDYEYKALEQVAAEVKQHQ